MFNPFLNDELAVAREIAEEAAALARQPGDERRSGNRAGLVSQISSEMAFPATSATLVGAKQIEFTRGGHDEDGDGNPLWALVLDADSLDVSPLA